MNPRREGDGWTPLHLAAMFGKCDVAQVLLEAGASSSIIGSDGKTAEDVAKQYRHHCLADILHRLAPMFLFINCLKQRFPTVVSIGPSGAFFNSFLHSGVHSDYNSTEYMLPVFQYSILHQLKPVSPVFHTVQTVRLISKLCKFLSSLSTVLVKPCTNGIYSGVQKRTE